MLKKQFVLGKKYQTAHMQFGLFLLFISLNILSYSCETKEMIKSKLCNHKSLPLFITYR
jgi:hypothetical protein